MAARVPPRRPAAAACAYPWPVTDPLSWLSAPCVMGILNVTPDSLWGGDGPIEAGPAMERLAAMERDGAAICDVGAESTRPGSEPVGAGEQLARLDGVLCGAARGAALDRALDRHVAGAGGRGRPRRGGGAGERRHRGARRPGPAAAGGRSRRRAVPGPHARSAASTMQSDPRYGDVVAEVRDALAERLDAAVAAGRARGAGDPRPGHRLRQDARRTTSRCSRASASWRRSGARC